MTEGSEYPYGYDFQVRLLALAVREHRFIEEFSFLLLPQYFDHEEFKHIARLLQNHFTRFAKVPELSVFRDSIYSYCQESKLPQAMQEKLDIVVDNILQVDLVDGEWIKEEAIRFAQGQLMKSAILESYQSLNDPKSYQNSVSKFQRIMDIAAPKAKVLDFRAVASDIPRQLREHSMFSQSRKIPFGIPSLDEDTFGGASCGKLGVILANSGYGKTHWLTHMGAQALEHGFPVFHFVFGDMNEYEMATRYAAHFTQISSRLIQTEAGHPGNVSNDYYAAINRWIQSSKADLLISAYPALSITPSQLKSIISSLIVTRGVKPGLIIVDYADNLATGMKMTSDQGEMAAQMGVVYQQLLNIAGHFEAALWTGSQVQRVARIDQVIHPHTVSGSIKKHDHSDYIFSLNQSDQEVLLNTARLYTGKIRNGIDKKIIPVLFSKATSTFTFNSDPNVSVEVTVDSAVAQARNHQRAEKAAAPKAIENIENPPHHPVALSGMLKDVKGPFNAIS